MSERLQGRLSSHLVARGLGLAVGLALLAWAVPAAAQLPALGGCEQAALTAAELPQVEGDITPVLMAKPDRGSIGDDDEVTAQYCYWRELVDCGGCTYHFSCQLWYGWDNRFGKECIGRRVEYCDGHPTGNEVPVLELQCGCNP